MQLHEQGKNSKLLLVGEGSDHSSLVDKARELGIQNDVIFVGSVTNVADYLQAMDVFVFPSLYEGLGMALVEAQAMGLPAISSDTVPQSANISGNVHFLPLHDIPAWVAQCASVKIGDRTIIDDNLLQSHNYEIHAEAVKLQNFYLNALSQID